jgi:3-deoxy-D-manno-octulosonic acid (KDO) 8-phosphate synthase
MVAPGRAARRSFLTTLALAAVFVTTRAVFSKAHMYQQLKAQKLESDFNRMLKVAALSQLL